jgi:hypothetical protein
VALSAEERAAVCGAIDALINAFHDQGTHRLDMDVLWSRIYNGTILRLQALVGPPYPNGTPCERCEQRSRRT